MKRKLIWTLPVLENIERQVAYLESRNPSAAKKFINNIFAKAKLLRDFPDIGRPILQYKAAKRKAEYRLAVESIPETDLTFKETIIDQHILMYGFNEKVVVILFIKHQAQKDY